MRKKRGLFRMSCLNYLNKKGPQHEHRCQYLLLFSELHLHLFVPWLVFANAVTGDEVAADVRQLWVLLPCLFDETEE